MLRSPYYPGNYPKNRDCVYLISQPVGKAIQLDFIDFDIEAAYDSRCLFDFLEIRDGDNENSTLIGHYCGGNVPETILSSMNYLWIRFKTDGSLQNKGFIANFSTIDVGCGGILRGSKMGKKLSLK
ncbi:unnamed protein product [Allacma fusca]|uniref:CUB domain-containing protein n=1 Tax=Allacma fusca TaxID=39272 RepID=A0A8J2L2Y6_9HEXA|nr:unnamed protein product [Allacma fusca]